MTPSGTGRGPFDKLRARQAPPLLPGDLRHMTSSAPSPRLAFPALLLGAIAIGFVPLLVRKVELDPSAIAFWRVLLALPVFVVWAVIQRRQGTPGARTLTPDDTARAGVRRPLPQPVLNRKEILWLLAPGVLFAADLSTWHVCIRWTSLANATLLANFTPVYMTLAGWLWWRERPTGGFLAGAGLALVGAAILLGADFGRGEKPVQGDFVGLLAALFYSGYLLAVKSLRNRHGAAEVMAGSALACALVLLPVMLLCEERVVPPAPRDWAVMLAMAWFCHALGQGLIAWALPALPAGLAAVGLLAQVVVAAATGWRILGEPVTPIQFLGGAVLLAGIWQARRKGI